MNLDLNLEEINIFETFNNNTSPGPSTNDISPSPSTNEMSPSVSDNISPSPSTEVMSPSVSDNISPSPSTEVMSPSVSDNISPSPSTEEMTPSQSGGGKFDKLDLERGSILDIGDNKKYILVKIFDVFYNEDINGFSRNYRIREIDNKKIKL